MERSISKNSAKSAGRNSSNKNERRLSRSRKKIKSVKRNIFKQTNGFRDTSCGPQATQKKPRSKSRKSSTSVSKRRLSASTFSRARELGKKCVNLMRHSSIKSKDKATKTAGPSMRRKRSISNNGKRLD